MKCPRCGRQIHEVIRFDYTLIICPKCMKIMGESCLNPDIDMTEISVEGCDCEVCQWVRRMHRN
jgi:ribosomal protein L37AE/L43A